MSLDGGLIPNSNGGSQPCTVPLTYVSTPHGLGSTFDVRRSTFDRERRPTRIDATSGAVLP